MLTLIQFLYSINNLPGGTGEYFLGAFLRCLALQVNEAAIIVFFELVLFFVFFRKTGRSLKC